MLRAEKAKALHEQGVGYREIARQLGINKATAKKYADGDPEEVCRYHRTTIPQPQFALDEYRELILNDISAGVKLSVIHRKICETGYGGSYGTFVRLCKTLSDDEGIKLNRGKCTGHMETPPDKITRAGVFKHIWEGLEITPEHLAYILEHYPSVGLIDKCVREFRDIFKHKSIPRLHCFIENYSNCGIKPIESFARGLANDIDAVENAAGTRLSNGFVEGTNSKTKMLKRVMYGRCGLSLLRAKIILSGCTD